MDKQPVYKVVDQLFEGFVKGNWKWIKAIEEGSIVSIAKIPQRKLYSTYVLDYPYNVEYIGMVEDGVNFFDRNQNKIYTYYT